MKVEAFPGPAATTARPEHKPLHVHVREKGQKVEMRVLMEDWVDGGKLKGRTGDVYPGDRSLTKKEKRVVSRHMDDLPGKTDSVFRTGAC